MSHRECSEGGRGKAKTGLRMGVREYGIAFLRRVAVEEFGSIWGLGWKESD